MAPMSLDSCLGDAIEDASEETFLLFSQTLPSHTLGFVDGKAGIVEFDIGGKTFTFKQSPGLLNSQSGSGATGAVLWKITPLVAEWLASMPQVLRDAEILHPGSTVIELGCGITGLLGIVLAEKVSNYVLTDQSYVMKTLRENVQQNTGRKSQAQQKRKQAEAINSNLRTVSLDWEINSPATVLQDVDSADHADMIIVCDCVYNEYLIQPLVQTLIELCNLCSSGKIATVMIAQQLRSNTVFEDFLEAMLRRFIVWRVSDSHLPNPLHSGSGYVVHLAQLRHNGTEPGAKDT